MPITCCSEQEERQASNLARYAGEIVPILGGPDTLDVVVNVDGRLWVNRLGRGFSQEGSFQPAVSKLLLNGIATVRQVPFDHDHPILETIFPLTGDRTADPASRHDQDANGRRTGPPGRMGPDIQCPEDGESDGTCRRG